MELTSWCIDGSGGLFALLLLPSVMVFLIIAAVVFRGRVFGIVSRPLNLPPGPRALPIIGHLHLLGRNPHLSLFKLSKKYGDLMFLRLGSVPTLIVSSPSAARLVLQTHDQSFSGRPNPGVPMTLVGCKNILFSQPGPYWKRARQIFATHLLRSEGSLSPTFRPLVVEEVRALVRSIAENSGSFIPVRASLYSATGNIISRMAVGKRMSELVSRVDASSNLVSLLLEAIQLAGEFNIGDFIPWLSGMDLQGCERKAKAIKPKLESLWQEVIDARRAMRKQSEGEDLRTFLDILLSDAEENPEITDRHIMAILTDVFGGGIDTSAITVEWAMAELLASPTAMRSIQQEIRDVLGDSSLVSESDIERLPYLMATVKETLRLHPPAPLLVPHVVNRPCYLLDYDVPPNAQAYINVWAIGRHQNTWEKPLQFCPERFLTSKFDVRGTHYELLPFGSGRRICPGMLLGLSNVHIMLGSLLQAFDWETMKKPNLTERFGIVMTLEEPLEAKATLRIPKHILDKTT
ncbi:hypothetical protein KP509_16G059000 [Ceratopteris richardii]|uniref:Cytochrome P450 n=1 Tax=Ceratopteris richardii TaxID=49495 RepID=A0A8T2SZ83_CERRI|nr:hypothetical protein KP509_16G059000 [Ceratopteris richardii]